MDNSVKARIAAIAAHWNKVERRAKEVEHYQCEATVPAINELRYAGRRLADAVAIYVKETPTAEELKLAEEHLIITQSYIVNADHDLTDAVVLYTLIRIKRLLDRYGRPKVESTFPEYKDLAPILDSAKKTIQGTREDRASRQADYERLGTEYLPKIMMLHNKITESSKLPLGDETQLDGKIQLLSIFTFAASLASILGLILTVYIWLATPPCVISCPPSAASTPSNPG